MIEHDGVRCIVCGHGAEVHHREGSDIENTGLAGPCMHRDQYDEPDCRCQMFNNHSSSSAHVQGCEACKNYWRHQHYATDLRELQAERDALRGEFERLVERFKDIDNWCILKERTGHHAMVGEVRDIIRKALADAKRGLGKT